MKKKTLISSIYILAFLMLCPLISQAQEQPTNLPQPKNLPTPTPPANSTDCFEYYRFQSVQVSLGTDKDVYLPGEKISLAGSLINENDYPVVDGNVFARISEENSNYVSEGRFIVEETILATDVNLDAKEIKAVEYQWNIPQTIKKGDYRIDFFFSVGKKFNLGGLPFSNEVIIGFDDFQIDSSQVGTIMFDRSKTTVNGEKYNHIGSWPNIEPNAKAEIVQPIKNDTNESKVINVKYDLYFWDSLNEKDKISSKTEEVSVPANSSYDLKYTIDSMKDSVYMLKITAVSDNLKSIVNIRLTSDQEHARLNYPAITKFPLIKNDNFTMFSCFHNTSWRDTAGSVRVLLYDRNGKLIDQMEYQGDITGAMMANKKDLKAEKDYDYLKLKAQVLDKNSKVVDEYEAVYDCNKLDSSTCFNVFGKKAGVAETEPGEAGLASKKSSVILIVILAILLVVLIVLIVKRKKIGIRMMIFFFLLTSLAIFSGDKAEAKYAKSVTTNHSLYSSVAFWGHWGNWFSTSHWGLVNLTHKMEMTAGDLTVKVGNPLQFSYMPELFFYTSGGAWDTPYGTWTTNLPNVNTVFNQIVGEMDNRHEIANYQLHESSWCYNSNYYYLWADNYYRCPWYGYMTVMGIKPIVSMTSGDSNIIECTGLNCVAKNTGEVTLAANIGETELESFVFGKTYGQHEWFKENSGILAANYYPATSASNVFKWTVTVLPDYSCTNIPANATMCANDDIGLTGDTSVTLVSACTDGRKCEYIPAAPTLTLTKDPKTAIDLGKSAEISWTTTNATSCTAAWTTSTKTNGLQEVKPTATTTYTMKCQNIVGVSVTESITVTVNKCGGPPSCNSYPYAESCGTSEEGAGSWKVVPTCRNNVKCECKCVSPCIYKNGACACPVNAECGDNLPQSSCKAPSGSNLCNNNITPSNMRLDVTNRWVWTCAGKDGGTSATCYISKDCSWIEVNP